MDNILRIFKGVDEEGHPKPFPLDANGEPDGENNIISDFTYSARRMGNAPNITCTFKYPICLDEQWDDTVYVEFKNEKFFINKTPTSSYSNTEALYKHEVTFVSERVILENVYFFNVVRDPENDNLFLVNSTKVPLDCKIDELTDRLNLSIKYSGLQEIGYKAILDDRIENDGNDELYDTSRQISVDDKFIYEVLKEIYETYNIPFYFVGKEIHFGFGNPTDVISEDTNTPLQYGIDHSLLSIKKNNSNERVINRITGVGSPDNIPYYYPNPTERGTIDVIFEGQITKDDIEILNSNTLVSSTSVDDVVTFRKKQVSNVVLGYQYKYHVGLGENEWRSATKNKTGAIKVHTYTSVNTLPSADGYYAIRTQFRVTTTITSLLDGDVKIKFRIPCIDDNPNKVGYYENNNDYSVWEIENNTNDVTEKSKVLQRGKFHFPDDWSGELDLGYMEDSSVRKLLFVWQYTSKHTGKPQQDRDPSTYIYIDAPITVESPTTYEWKGERIQSEDISEFGITLKEDRQKDIEQNPEKYVGSSFYVKILKKLQNQPNLMPPIYRDGKLFYNALNDTYEVDKDYEEGDEKKYIQFDNPYIEGKPHEHIENFDDIKPTIKGIVNGEKHNQPLDQIIGIEFDKEDNNEVDENGEFKHPYFFVKLPKYNGEFGFNLFDSAIAKSEMVIAMTSGKCSGCEFRIAVDADSLDNMVQVEDDGTLSRNEHGDVLCYRPGQGSGNSQPQQNDTINNEVWLVLEKDDKTFGTTYPDSRNNYIPEVGDTFVILNINLPESYIFAAEKRLEKALISYMEEHNNERFTFSVQFSRIFLAEHPEIAQKINENSKVWLNYNDNGSNTDNGEGNNNVGTVINVSSYTYKVNQGEPLPEITVELNDKVVVAKNVIASTVDKAKTEILSRFSTANIVAQLTPYHVRKDIDDVVSGQTKFAQGLVSYSPIILHEGVQSTDFVSGINTGSGWCIDERGNAELESVRVRSSLEAQEMIINKTYAQEGELLFTDSDQIENVSYYHGNDDSVSYVLTLKEKYDGYVHTQLYGNILKGTINALATKGTGLTDDIWLKNDYSGEEDLESDVSGNKYYVSWMIVVDTHSSNSNLGLNQIRVILCNNDDIPSKKNFVPCKLMNIARWGCIDYSIEGDNEAIKESIKARQTLFAISNLDGRMVKLRGVNKPKLDKYNYGTTIGILPEFVQKYTSLEGRLSPERDYLYAQGIVVSDLIKITPTGDPIINYVDCGEWVDGSKVSEPDEPKLGKGKYLHNEYNNDTAQWETHDVWHYGLRWRCLQSQPVKSNGEETYHEPTWGIKDYWQPIEGDMSLTMEFTSSNGYSFRRNAAWETTITPHIFFGSMEITNYEQKVKILGWERKHEVEKGDSNTLDVSWNDNHKEIKELKLTQNDMSVYWSSKNKMIFTCIAEVSDGNNTIIVENQITA